MARCLYCDHAIGDGSIYCSQGCADADQRDPAEERQRAFLAWVDEEPIEARPQ